MFTFIILNLFFIALTFNFTNLFSMTLFYSLDFFSFIVFHSLCLNFRNYILHRHLSEQFLDWVEVPERYLHHHQINQSKKMPFRNFSFFRSSKKRDKNAEGTLIFCWFSFYLPIKISFFRMIIYEWKESRLILHLITLKYDVGRTDGAFVEFENIAHATIVELLNWRSDGRLFALNQKHDRLMFFVNWKKTLKRIFLPLAPSIHHLPICKLSALCF